MKKRTFIAPMAAAVAVLMGASAQPSNAAASNISNPDANAAVPSLATNQPLTLDRAMQPGIVLAQDYDSHVSHASHASHDSHASHTSSY